MMRRLLKWLVLPVLAVAILGVGFKSWLLHSDSGMRWLVAQISAQLGEQLNLGKVSGNLDSGLQLHDLIYRSDGLEVKITRVEASGVVSLLPLKITVSSLHAFDVFVHTFPTTKPAPSQEDTLEDILADLQLPLDLDMQDVKITRLKVIDERNEVLFKLEDAALSLRWKDAIEIRKLEIDSGDFQAGLKGRLQLSSPFAHDLQLNGLVAGLTDYARLGSNAGRFEASLKGAADSSDILVSHHDPAVEVSGRIEHPFDDAQFDLQVLLAEHLISSGEPDSDIVISDVIGKLQGLPTNYQVQLSATLMADGYPPADIALAGQGDLSSLNVDQLRLKAEFVEASASGSVGWAERFSYDLKLELQQLLPSIWLPEWPDEKFIYGQVALVSAASSIRIDQLSAKIEGTPVDVTGQAVIDLEANILDGQLHWSSLGWPLWQQPYQISSQSGELQLSGAPADWKFEGDMNLHSPQYPGGLFSLRGNGGLETADIVIDKGQVLGGIVTGNASLDWQNELNWQANVSVEDLDTSVLLSEWPARLDAAVKVSQSGSEQSFLIQIDRLHAELDGQFKGQSLDGNGVVRLADDGYFFDDLQLYSEQSRLTLQGNPVVAEGIKFSLDIGGRDWVSSYLGGEISGRGQIALAAEQPIIDVRLDATNLHWGDTRVERISIAPADSNLASGINLAMDISALKMAGAEIQTAKLTLTGDRNQQALSLDVSERDYRFHTSLAGALSSWTSLQGLSWTGVIEDTALWLNEGALLTQSAANSVVFSAQQITLAQTCLTTPGSGGLCVSSDWQPSGDFEVAVSLSEIPLAMSSLVFDHGIDFSQTLGGEFKWQQARGLSPSGRMAVKISAGEFGDMQENYDRVQTAEGFLGFELHEGNLTAGELDVPFPGVGLVDFDYGVNGLLLDGTGIVDGNLKIDLNDISVLEGLIPGLENFGGQLKSNLLLSGSTSDPHLDGNIDLLGGGADIPMIGLQLREVSLKGDISNSDSARLEGSFRAGDGLAQLKLTSSFADWDSPDMQLSISGKDLRVLNMPELRMDADSDVTIGWANQQWTVGGSVLVQETQITPVTVVIGKVNESEDVTIVQGELPYSGEQQEQKPIKLNGNLQITLGENVRVETDLVKAKLAGGVNLTWQDNLIPVGDGAIGVSGVVSVFGPRLTLNDGQIRFPNIPVDNPVLAIRAERDVFGNTQIRTAGVAITGTAKRPDIDAFTVPLTNSDRAWALLITGNDVDYGQSVGAFEVGTYIAPRLYLSYGISLFNDGNVVSARYDLKKGFGIKASSGQREAGIDVSYTVDR